MKDTVRKCLSQEKKPETEQSERVRIVPRTGVKLYCMLDERMLIVCKRPVLDKVYILCRMKTFEIQIESLLQNETHKRKASLGVDNHDNEDKIPSNKDCRVP